MHAKVPTITTATTADTHSHTHNNKQIHKITHDYYLNQQHARFFSHYVYATRANYVKLSNLYYDIHNMCFALPFATLFSLPSAASSNHNNSSSSRRRRCRRRCCCRHTRRCRHCRLRQRHRHHRQHGCSVTLSSRRLNEH